MNHYIRDLSLSSYITTNDKAMGVASFVIYHFLRNAGWSWLWECDGESATPNHCPDGNMEAFGTTSWSVDSTGTLSKSTSQQKNGEQSLSWEAAASENLTSANFTGLTDTNKYQVSIWVYNNTGNTFTFDVFDGNAFTSSVNASSNGTWTQYRISFTKNAAGSAYMRLTAPGGTPGTIYIDSISVYQSFFEDSDGLLADYSDGQISASNVFSSASYSFSAGDVGRVVVVWDTTNLGNSGAYAIASVASGNATLNIRAGGAETLTAQTGLSWRLLDLTYAPHTESESVAEAGCGWGLESAHSSNWRLFWRHNIESASLDKLIVMWGAPKDTDFDPSDGSFYLSDVSTHMLDSKFAWNNFSNKRMTVGDPSATVSRLYFQTDDEGSFVSWCIRDDQSSHCYGVIGFTGTYADHTTEETWAMLTRYNSDIVANELALNDVATAWWNAGVAPFKEGMVECTLALYGTSESVSLEPITMTNAKANPFDSTEWLQKLILERDPSNEEGASGERVSSLPVYIARQNMSDFSTFDSDQYIHLDQGVVWEWPGFSVLT